MAKHRNYVPYIDDTRKPYIKEGKHRMAVGSEPRLSSLSKAELWGLYLEATLVENKLWDSPAWAYVRTSIRQLLREYGRK